MKSWTPRAAILVAALLLPLASAAVFSGMDLNGRTADGARVIGGSVDRSNLEDVLIRDADVSQSQIARAGIEDSNLREVQVKQANLRDSTLAQARVESSVLHDVTLGADVTLCRVGGDRDLGSCALVSPDGNVVARIEQDAPATAHPNGSFDVKLDLQRAANALTVHVAPSFLPVESATLGIRDVFDVSAVNAIRSVEVHHDGRLVASGGAGQALALPGGMDGDVTLRVHLAEKVVDTSMLRLRVDTGNGAITFAPTQIQVVGTQLAILPQDQQPFGPYFADALGRLVATSVTDQWGNADRDIDVAMTERALDYAGPDHLDGTHSASVHGDAEFLGNDPIQYSREHSAAAHHPLTLEFVTRQVNKLDVPFGGLPVHATHVVAMGPYETRLELTASAVNARGERLEAGPVEFVFAPAAQTETVVTNAGGSFAIPGTGQLIVQFKDDAGDRVRYHETPESHDIFVTRHVADDEDNDVHMQLASSVKTGLPFGNFVASEYAVVADGERVNEDLVHVEAGQTQVLHHH